MYILKNIANDRFKGALFKNDAHFGAAMHPLSLRLEPWIGDKQLKLGAQRFLTDEEYLACSDVISTHIKGNVIEVLRVDDVTIIAETPPATIVETAPLAVEEKIKVEIPEVQIEIREQSKFDMKKKKKD